MGAGASVAEELASPRLNGHRRGRLSNTTTGCQYREMLEHLRNRFVEEVRVLRAKHGDVDQDALIVKLLIDEFSFTTVEVDDLPVLKQRPRDRRKVYLLGETHFGQAPPLECCVDMTNLTPKALEMVGDEKLSAVAREALPANTRTSKKAVELMGSTKVVTEKKALKRLGSEMTEDMRVLQVKTERKQQQKEEENRRNMVTGVEGGAGGGGGGGADGGRAADGAGVGRPLSSTKSMTTMKVGSPSSFAASPMARRATRLLTEVPRFISEMGGGSSTTDPSSK